MICMLFKKYCPTPNKFMIILLSCLKDIFFFLFTVMSLLSLELIFGNYNVGHQFHLYVDMKLYYPHLLKRLSFPHLSIITYFSHIKRPYMYESSRGSFLCSNVFFSPMPATINYTLSLALKLYEEL